MDGARSMVERSSWLVPYYRGEPFFDKPVLTYWLIASSFRIFGFTPAAARLVPALAALLLVVVTVLLGERLFGRREGLWGGAVLATTFGFMTFGRWAMSDMLLALFSTLSFSLGRRLFEERAPGFALPVLGAVLGLGFLTKGPIALLLPGLGLLLLHFARGTPRLNAKGVALAALLFVVIGLSWFLAVYVRLGAGPLEHFFLRENLERFAGDTYDSGRSPFFYLASYMAEGAPWSFLLPLALMRLFGRGRESSGGARDARGLVLWVCLMLFPLSVSRGKIDYYILPLYPPLSLVVGRFLASTLRGPFEVIWARGAALVSAVVAAGGPFLLARVPGPWAGGPSRVLFDLVAGLSALGLLRAALDPSTRVLRRTFALTAGALFAVAAAFVVPQFVRAQPNAGIVRAMEREHLYQPDVSVVRCEDPSRVERDLLFYARVPVVERCDLWYAASSERPFLLLLDANERDALRDRGDFRMVYGQDALPSAVLSLDRLFLPVQPRPLFLAANYASSDPRVIEHDEWMRKRRERIRAELVERGQEPD